MTWQTPKTNWQAADVVSKDDFNRIEGNIQELQDTKETPAGAQTKANTAEANAKAYTNAHEQKAAPHSGHETPAGAQAKADAAAGAVQAELDAHVSEYATLDKAGHVKAETDADGRLILDIPKSNYNADRLPNENDDETQGYSVGSVWVTKYQGTDLVFFCNDSSQGNAVWSLIPLKSSMMLFSNGDEYVDVTGGWEEGYNDSPNWAYVIIGSSDIRLTRDGSGTYNLSVVTNYTINLSFIDKLFIEWRGVEQSSYSCSAHFQVADNKNGDRLSGVISEVSIDGTFSRVISELDVSNLDGEYYIRVFNRINANLYIYKVWGETR